MIMHYQISLQLNIQYMRITIFLICLVCMLNCSNIGEQISLGVTIYNNNFAMVKDVREIEFQLGQSNLYFTDVSQNIQTQTVTFKALNNSEKIRVYEQNFEKNLVNRQQILQRYIDKQVQISAVVGNTVEKVKGKLLGYNSGFIIQVADGIQIYKNIDGIKFPSLPSGFFTLPTLNWKVYSQQKTKVKCEVAYRTTGFKWKADYLVSINSDETIADISSWVTIDNNSGKKYVNSKLKLIAGDVNTVNQYQPQPYMKKMRMQSMAMDAGAPEFSEKSFADYHMYTLSRPVTLNSSSSKQVEFMPKAINISIKKFYLVVINAGGYEQNVKAQNIIKFNNSEQEGLGFPLPKGTVRVFKNDQSDDSLQFIGEDSIDHTPKNQQITITTGNAFDITIKKTVVQRINHNMNGNYEAKMKLEISNHRSTPAQIQIRYNNPYGNNLQMNLLYDKSVLLKQNANRFKWTQTFAADETIVFGWNQKKV